MNIFDDMISQQYKVSNDVKNVLSTIDVEKFSNIDLLKYYAVVESLLRSLIFALKSFDPNDIYAMNYIRRELGSEFKFLGFSEILTGVKSKEGTIDERISNVRIQFDILTRYFGNKE